MVKIAITVQLFNSVLNNLSYEFFSRLLRLTYKETCK